MINGYKDAGGKTISTDRKCSVNGFCDFYDESEHDNTSFDFVCGGCRERVDLSEFLFVDWHTIKANRQRHDPDGWK